ncbi:hypothetical protein N7520_012007 [Penicillium odoratum]|uniref:uncharacterized protein n=1 Tax=Penicillium odoratum TaxID=1167516 RepID=UPI0025481545|nr:uncharacterized protein N7520_012007 [Penicillium odoratum]KAJ5746825.1 hypothetical protein N7520_012007 [Penicillium odoratum]
MATQKPSVPYTEDEQIPLEARPPYPTAKPMRLLCVYPPYMAKFRLVVGKPFVSTYDARD